MAIVRVLRARVKPGRRDDWRRMVRELSIPALSSAPGLLACYPGQQLVDGDEFAMVSVWQDLDAVRAYAGEDWQLPILYGDEADVVDEVDVHHYEVFG